MARTCDNCGTKITDDNPVIGRLWLTPVKQVGRHRMSDYSATMEVGKCCTAWLTRLGWRKRKRNVRTKGGQNGAGSPTDALAAGKHDKAVAAK